MQTKDYYLAFSYAPNIGPKRLQQLIHAFGSVQQSWEASEKDIQNVIGKILGEKFNNFRNEFNIEKTLEELEKKQITFVTIEDKEYPSLLKQLVIGSGIRHSELDSESQEDSGSEAGMTNNGIATQTLFARNDVSIPFILYVKGNVSLLNDSKIIGIVGTRKITDYGKQVTHMITEALVLHDFTIVSGLAYGVDACAHQTTIDTHGKTIAVLGSGVDVCTPVENQRIYDQILDTGGTIVSTFLPGVGATIGSFPARNAIIAGLSLGVVVTEGASDSGSLITASDAKKFGRPVFAVPGPITSSLSKGSNSLLQQGAIAVTNGKDIITSLGIKTVIPAKAGIYTNRSPIRSGMTESEQEIIHILEHSPLHFDEIVRTIGKSAKEIGSTLSMMELKGMIRNTGGIYSLSSRA